MRNSDCSSLIVFGLENIKAKELLSGAYITDLIKMNQGICCAIPESDSSKVSLYLRKEKIDEQIQGLKEELCSLGITKPHFVLLHSRLENERLKAKLREIYGKNTFIGRLPHYSPQLKKFQKQSYDSYSEMYKDAVDDLVNEMIDWEKTRSSN